MRCDLLALVEELHAQQREQWQEDLALHGASLEWSDAARFLTRLSLATALVTIVDVLRRLREAKGLAVELSLELVEAGKRRTKLTAELQPAMAPCDGVSAETVGLEWPRPAPTPTRDDPGERPGV